MEFLEIAKKWIKKELFFKIAKIIVTRLHRFKIGITFLGS